MNILHAQEEHRQEDIAGCWDCKGKGSQLSMLKDQQEAVLSDSNQKQGKKQMLQLVIVVDFY